MRPSARSSSLFATRTSRRSVLMKLMMIWYYYYLMIQCGMDNNGVNGFVPTTTTKSASQSTRIRRFRVIGHQSAPPRQVGTRTATADVQHSLKTKWDAISQRVFPPIAQQERDTTIPIFGSFHPGFIVQEFGLGFRYMLSVMIFFWTASRLFDLFRVGLPLPQSMFVLNTHLLETTLTPALSVMDTACVKIFGEEICRETLPLWYVCLVSPLIEEITFRGLGLVLFQSTFQLGLLCLAYICHVGVYLGYAALAGLSIVAGTYGLGLLANMRGPQPILTCWTALLHLLAQLFICMGPALALMDIKRKPKTSDYNNSNSNASYYARVVLGLATGRSFLTTAREFDRTVSKSMLLHSRLATSFDFGLCHVSADCVPLPEAMIDFQKAFGSFASSLLVESRLAVNRRNVWAPFGAHVAWNFITSSLSYKSFLILWLLFQAVVACLGIRLRSTTGQQQESTA